MKSRSKSILSCSTAFLFAFGMIGTMTAPVNAADRTEVSGYSGTTATKRNVMYYGDWSIWGGQGNYYPLSIPADQLTHLNFAFLDFNASGELLFTDKDAATGAPVGMPGVQWNAANAGILSAMQELRAQNPNLKIGVSIGGWSKSGDFSILALNPTARAKLVENILKFLKYTNMDFVDLDWEYPAELREPDLIDNKNDEGTTHATDADKGNYILLLEDIRAGLDSQGTALNKKYELTVALPAPKAKLDKGIDIPRLFSVVDFANIMTYDMRGAWNETSGHQAGLYTNPNDPLKDDGLSADASVQYLISQGAPSDKIVIGVAFYTRGWEKVANTSNTQTPGLFGDATIATKDSDQTPSRGAANEAPLKDGEGGRCGGVWSYGSMDKLKAAYPGLIKYWDDTAKAPYLYNESTGAFFTYDDEQSIQEKADYVDNYNLGGMIAWMASQDAVTDKPGVRDELTKAMKTSLFGSTALPTYTISNPDLDVTVTIETFTEEWSNNKGYTITLKNNSKKDESGEVLNLVELASETVKSPKLYIKTASGATFKASGYGAGEVTNEDGYGIIDLSTVYDNQTIKQGGTCTFQLSSSTEPILEDILSIELTQRIIPTGAEISRQTIYGSTK